MDTTDTTTSTPRPSTGGTRTLTVAVVGGTGTLGRQVADALRTAGHDVRALSRHSDHPVDLTTGQGLASALAGCDVVVDAANAPKSPTATLVEGTERLLDAEAAAGVALHVSVDIVGCEAVPMAYFEAKAAQQHVVESGPVAWSTVRATQFHDYVAATLAGYTRWGMTLVPPMRVQPVASAEVAAVVARVAQQPASRGATTVAGPETRELRDLAHVWKRVTGHRALLVPVAVPGAGGRALRSGVLTTDAADVRGTRTFEQWLAARAAA